jgi:transcriptional regulator with XRE-family HTH domain
MSPLNYGRVRELRIEAGLSQVDLAKAAGIRQATISRIETGQATRVTVDMLEAIAQALGCEPADLLTKRKRGR